MQKERKQERKFIENSKVRHLILLVAGKEVLWNGKSGKGMAKLRRARRGVWEFEEVSLVIVDGLVAEFVKMRYPILRLWERKFWRLVACGWSSGEGRPLYAEAFYGLHWGLVFA